jgi:hypothetical protein
LTAFEDFRGATLANATLQYPNPTLQYSPSRHSILLMYRNALIYKRKIFLLTVKARPSSRQNFSLLISKEKLRVLNFLRFQRLSLSIGGFSRSADTRELYRGFKKKTVAHYHTQATTSA